MEKPCGNDKCERWLASNGYFETNDEVCTECGFCGPYYQWMQSRPDDNDDDDNGEW